MDDTRGRVDVEQERTRSPRVALSALSLRSDGSGVQTYARELISALPRAWPAATFTALVARDVADLGPHIERQTVLRGFESGLVRKVLSSCRVPSADIAHGLDTDQPLRASIATVATVHDLALFDVPWAFSSINGKVKRSLVAASIRRADALISVSDFTADRVRARFGRESTVIHEAAGTQFSVPSDDQVRAVLEKYRLTVPFVLFVGNHEPRKDLACLAEACSIAGLPLVVVGGAISNIALPPTSLVLGYVPQADLPGLYRAATVVGYVARYEGFALPPVEAMACGGCVMATRVGALPDIATEGIEFVPVGSPQTQAEAIRSLHNDVDKAAHRRSSAIGEAGMLSWSKAAMATAEVYRTLL